MGRKRCIIPLLFPRSGRGKAVVAVAVLAVLVALGGGWLYFRQKPSPKISPSLRAASEGLTDYQLSLRLIPEERSLAITEIIRYGNQTGETLHALKLRCWLNAFIKEETSPAALEEIFDACYQNGFSAGGMTLYDVSWNGQAVSHTWEQEDQTVLRVEIPPLANSEEGTLMLRCVARLPECAYRSGVVNGVYQLGNVIPLVSCFMDGEWRTDAYSSIGDPFVSECANFHVTLEVPETYVPACSAWLIREKDGLWRGDLPAARDMALVLYDHAALVEGEAGDTVIRSYAQNDAQARRALTYARQALETFQTLYGPYPYPVYTVCQVDFPFGGMEYPALCMIGKDGYAAGKEDSLELTITHETAHQWFYALVGSDQANAPWQDEALCEYAMLRYVQKRYGQSSFDALRYYRVDAAIMESIPGGLTPGAPISYFNDLHDYRTVVYGRGAALLLALDEFLPGGTDAFLRDYAERFSYQLISRADFEEFLNRYAGLDASPLLLDYLDTKME